MEGVTKQSRIREERERERGGTNRVRGVKDRVGRRKRGGGEG